MWHIMPFKLDWPTYCSYASRCFWHHGVEKPSQVFKKGSRTFKRIGENLISMFKLAHGLLNFGRKQPSFLYLYASFVTNRRRPFPILYLYKPSIHDPLIIVLNFHPRQLSWFYVMPKRYNIVSLALAVYICCFFKQTNTLFWSVSIAGLVVKCVTFE